MNKFHLNNIIKIDIAMEEKMDKMLLPGLSNNFEIERWQNELSTNRFKGVFKNYDDVINFIKKNDISVQDKFEMLLSLEKWKRPFEVIKLSKILGFVVKFADTAKLGGSAFVIAQDKNDNKFKKIALIDKEYDTSKRKLALCEILCEYVKNIKQIELDIEKEQKFKTVKLLTNDDLIY